MNKYFKTVGCLLFCCFYNVALSHNLITDFRFSDLPSRTRLVFETSHSPSYTAKIFPTKIVITIERVKIVEAINKQGMSTSIGAFTILQNNNEISLIINLTKSVQCKHFILSKPYRLILDLYPTEITTITEPSHLRDVIVVIDPGHGGRDSGAIGYHGVHEKYINLAVAKELYNIINNIVGFRAFLTRNDDYFVSLRKRLEIARLYKADIFVSIHADAYRHRKAYGASVFALSPRGATSEAARWLAEKENESISRIISNKNRLLRSVLIELTQTATISASLDIGNKVLDELNKITNLHSPRVEQAAFAVLKSPDIPSLLIEIGFISHSKEELKLCSHRYQKKLALRIARGIYQYFSSRRSLYLNAIQ
ncbi:MAG: N-acetylmuramoyl-L-alanine amidase [Coxiellaceae bacterium]|jgi:N-acetylmuramoyl-L-alanine amidase|nr:N-acetylmuramoyl-L-alanine amidase [Coxiellaceae bacterium]